MPRSTLPTLHLPTLEKLAVSQAMRKTKNNKSQAARLLGVHLRTLQRTLARYTKQAK